VSSNTRQIVVIGGGVIGAMCAWELSIAGCDVTIIDRDRFGAACSHGNCGYVSPSHVLPLSQPGAIQDTLRQMMKRNSPFAIKPRMSLSSWKWFWNFARHCNQSDMLSSAAGRHELLQSSKSRYQEIIRAEAIDCEWQERGLLFVYENERGFDNFRKTNEMIAEKFGVAAVPYDERALLQLEPALKPGLAGAWYYECDCHLRPDKLLSAMRGKLESRGVKIIESFPVDEIVREAGRAKSVSANGQFVEGDQFLIATGAWTPFLNRQLGCQIPIEPGKGYSLTMPTPKNMPRIPLVFCEAHVAITPMESKYRIGSTMEFVGYDTSIHPRRLGLLKTAAQKYLHDPLGEPIEEEWYGWRPMTWDGKPVLDRSPAMENVWIAAGHNMLGLSMAAGTGKLMRELILHEKPHIDPAHFAISRFQ
jgi:D-amino-acid dehydrogenase